MTDCETHSVVEPFVFSNACTFTLSTLKEPIKVTLFWLYRLKITDSEINLCFYYLLLQRKLY